MAPRERFARIWVTAIGVVGVAYVVALWAAGPLGIALTPLTRFGLLGAAFGGLGLAAGVGCFVVRDGDGLLDERDRQIEARSSAIAYYALVAAMIVVGCVMPFSAQPWDIAHAAIASILGAEVIHYVVMRRGYRQGLA